MAGDRLLIRGDYDEVVAADRAACRPVELAERLVVDERCYGEMAASIDHVYVIEVHAHGILYEISSAPSTASQKARLTLQREFWQLLRADPFAAD